MRLNRIVSALILFAFALLPLAVRADDDVIQTVSSLITDNDKEVRAVGLEQVRDDVKGEAATQRFAALLPQLSPEAQVGLLAALAERGDAAARPAVLGCIKSGQAEVRSAAIRALGPLGSKADVPQFIALLADADSEKDAVAAVARLRGADINAAIADTAAHAAPAVRAKVFQLLVARHATETVPVLLTAAGDADATVRHAAIEALGQLAAPEHEADLARLVLKAQTPAAREEAERAVMLVCQRQKNAERDGKPLFEFFKQASDADKTVLISTIGRVGGRSALAIVRTAIADKDPARSAAGLRALCNWPDGSVAPQLLEIARAGAAKADRAMALDALIRVAPLPDKRPDTVRLGMLQKAMELATTKEQKTTILRRARAIRTMDALHFVLPYFDDPAYAQVVAETVVELAHHKELRHPNKAEFDAVLDKAIKTSKSPRVIDEAKRYKEDRT